MDEIRHHLDDALLMSYAAGSLPEAFSIVVACHLSLCEDCRVRLGAFEAVGGAVLEDVEEAAMSPTSLDATIARIRMAPQTRTTRTARGRLPVPLDTYVGGDVSDVRWRSIGGGVRQMKLATAGAGTARLIMIPGGEAVPDHGHAGREITMVISGAYSDATDRFGPGDVEIADDDLEHQPKAEAGRPCICLTATEAPLKFRRLLPRVVGSVLGI